MNIKIKRNTKMYRYLLCTVTFLLLTFPFTVSSEQAYNRGHYQKAIISQGNLYLCDGFGEPLGYNASLTSIKIGDTSSLKKTPIYTGIRHHVKHPFPFRWDIQKDFFFSIAVNEYGLYPGHELVRYPLIKLEEIDEGIKKNIPIPFNEPLEEYIIGNLRVIQFAGLGVGGYQGHVFFDFLVTEKNEFQLYVTSKGEISLFRAKGFSREYWRKDLIKSQSWPIDFTGPFWIAQLGQRIYLFSEDQQSIYRLESGGFVPFLHLPTDNTEHTSERAFEHLFIIDKDNEQLIFFSPPFTQSASSTAIILGDIPIVRQEIAPALRSALSVYGMEKR